MKKTIIAAAIISLFTLVACNKPADKAADKKDGKAAVEKKADDKKADAKKDEKKAEEKKAEAK